MMIIMIIVMVRTAATIVKGQDITLSLLQKYPQPLFIQNPLFFFISPCHGSKGLPHSTSQCLQTSLVPLVCLTLAGPSLGPSIHVCCFLSPLSHTVKGTLSSLPYSGMGHLEPPGTLSLGLACGGLFSF